jgi:2-keto-3-deoxy-L-rhamnonate aldolase RhmA
MIAALGSGRTVFGTWIRLAQRPSTLLLLKEAGLDFVLVDIEHGSASMETVEALAVMGRALELPLIVRPPSCEREWISRLLDAGVWGLRIPGVDTAEIARRVVSAARYAPVGMRGHGPVGPYTDYTYGVAPELLNEQIHITVMLESPAGFANIDEILAVEGIDAVSIGPGDLRQELEVAGRPNGPAVIADYVEQMFAAARRHNKDVTMHASSAEEIEEQRANGSRIIYLPPDDEMLQRAYVALLSGTRRGPQQ